MTKVLEISVPNEVALASAVRFYAPQFKVHTHDAHSALLRRKKYRWLSPVSLQLLTAALFQTPPDAAAIAERTAHRKLTAVDADVIEIRLTIAAGPPDTFNRT